MERCLDGDGKREEGPGRDAGVVCDDVGGERPGDVGSGVTRDGGGEDDGGVDVEERSLDGKARALFHAESGGSSAQPSHCGDAGEPVAGSRSAGDRLSEASVSSDISCHSREHHSATSTGEHPPAIPVSSQPELPPAAEPAGTEDIVSSPAAARCPVCARPLPEQLLHVNRHLDECLNQKLLSEFTDGAPVAGTKRPAPHTAAPRSKLKRIDSFFRAKK